MFFVFSEWNFGYLKLQYDKGYSNSLLYLFVVGTDFIKKKKHVYEIISNAFKFDRRLNGKSVKTSVIYERYIR